MKEIELQREVYFTKAELMGVYGKIKHWICSRTLWVRIRIQKRNCNLQQAAGMKPAATPITKMEKIILLKVREKHHRLAREYYCGQINVAFTACIRNKQPFFLSNKIVDPNVEMLTMALAKNKCIAPVYCFMPEHLHIMVQGQTDDSNTWQAMVDFKQRSGYWLRMNHRTIKWQKDFYDHIIRKSEDLGAQVRYILENPVRQDLVKYWWEYLFSGAIGCDLQEVIESLACF